MRGDITESTWENVKDEEEAQLILKIFERDLENVEPKWTTRRSRCGQISKILNCCQTIDFSICLGPLNDDFHESI